MHCSELNLTAPIGPCDPGYYCPYSADTATYLVCTVGNYCEEGSDQPTPCPQGELCVELRLLFEVSSFSNQ